MSELRKFDLMGISLPECILSYKYTGDFDGEIRAIDAYLLRQDIPNCLKERLSLEKEIARGMAGEYTVTEEEAFDALSGKFFGFTQEKMQSLMDGGYIEWRFVNGKKMLSSSYLSSLSRKMKGLYADKIEKPTDSPTEKVKLIHEAIAEMKSKGYVRRRVRICHELTVDKNAERVGEVIRVHMPFPRECREQRDVKLISASHPFYISDAPSRTAFIETSLKKGEVFSLEYEYEIRMDYAKIDIDAPSYVRDESYVGEEGAHIRFTPLIINTAREIVGDEKNPIRQARLIYDYVTNSLRYSYMREYLLIENIPEFALTATVGDCGVMALLFITLCRAVGIPAFWQSGQSVTPMRVGSHDWATFEIMPYGMLHADLSSGEDASEKGDRERHDFFFGNVDPFRLIANDGFALEFDPPKRHMRIDPYDNQSGEAEYLDRGLRSGEIHSVKKIISFEKL